MSDRGYVAFHLATILATPFLILAVHAHLFIGELSRAIESSP